MVAFSVPDGDGPSEGLVNYAGPPPAVGCAWTTRAASRQNCVQRWKDSTPPNPAHSKEPVGNGAAARVLGHPDNHDG